MTTDDEFGMWLHGPTENALKLQRVAPLRLSEIVATGEQADPPEGAVAAPF